MVRSRDRWGAGNVCAGGEQCRRSSTSCVGRCTPAESPERKTVDLRVYFHKIRTIEATIPGDHAVVVSLETADGGREGRMNEVNRETAAKLVVQGKSRLATDEEAAEYRAGVRAAKKA